MRPITDTVSTLPSAPLGKLTVHFAPPLRFVAETNEGNILPADVNSVAQAFKWVRISLRKIVADNRSRAGGEFGKGGGGQVSLPCDQFLATVSALASGECRAAGVSRFGVGVLTTVLPGAAAWERGP